MLRRAFALALLAAWFPALSAAQSEATSAERKDEEKPRARPVVALVLPLASATYGRVAAAVKEGFVAAAREAGEEIAVIPHGDGEVAAAFAKARESGAQVIVGPLLRDDVRKIVAAGDESPTVLALNQPDDGALPPNMYVLALSIESDARQLARVVRDTGVQTVGIVGSDAPLQKRFAAAFTDAWLAQGGGAPVAVRFDRSPEALTAVKRDLARTPVDAALLAVDGPEAILVKPYLGTTAAFAGSSVNDRQPRDALRDLEDVRFVEIPWLATPESRTFAGIARPDFANATLDRLYALGIDAFRVARRLASGRTDKVEIDGATGRLTLGESRQFAREGRLMQFREGLAVPAATP